MFPAGLAGAALFLLRLGLIGILFDSLDWRLLLTSHYFWAVPVAGVMLALLFGIQTPFCCVGLLVWQIATLRFGNRHYEIDSSIHVLTTIALLLLGPGAYSVDSKLFGRRLILPPEM